MRQFAHCDIFDLEKIGQAYEGVSSLLTWHLGVRSGEPMVIQQEK